MSGHLGPIHHLPRQFHPRHSPQSLHTRHQLRELCALILRVLIRCHANVPELGVRVLPILPCKEVQNVIRRSHQTGEARKNGGRDRRAEGPDGDVEGEVERVDKRVAREEGREVRDGDGAIGTDGQARQSGESEAGQGKRPVVEREVEVVEGGRRERRCLQSVQRPFEECGVEEDGSADVQGVACGI